MGVKYLLSKTVNDLCFYEIPDDFNITYSPKNIVSDYIDEVFPKVFDYTSEPFTTINTTCGRRAYRLALLSVLRYCDTAPTLVSRYFELREEGIQVHEAFVLSHKPSVSFPTYMPSNHLCYDRMYCDWDDALEKVHTIPERRHTAVKIHDDLT